MTDGFDFADAEMTEEEIRQLSEHLSKLPYNELAKFRDAAGNRFISSLKGMPDIERQTLGQHLAMNMTNGLVYSALLVGDIHFLKGMAHGLVGQALSVQSGAYDTLGEDDFRDTGIFEQVCAILCGQIKRVMESRGYSLRKET